MKKILALALALIAFAAVSKADDRPVTADQLPAAAKTFIKSYYPDEKISFVTKDDDLIRPDFNVVLSNGVRIDFDNSGSLDKIEVGKTMMPSGIVPVQISDYVSAHFPEVRIIGYEVGRRTFEVKLSNGMDLKFNTRYALIEIDD